MTWEEVLMYVIKALAGIVVTAAIPCFFNWLRSKSKNEIVQKLITQAENTVEACVITVNQTFVDALKAEGAFDTVAAKNAFEMCKDKILCTLSDAAKAAIVQTVGDFDTWLQTQIESKVYLYKMNGIAIN